MTYEEYRVKIAIRIARVFQLTIDEALNDIGNIMDMYNDSVTLDEATWTMIGEIGFSS